MKSALKTLGEEHSRQRKRGNSQFQYNALVLEHTRYVQGQQRGCWYDTVGVREGDGGGKARERKGSDFSLYEDFIFYSDHTGEDLIISIWGGKLHNLTCILN